MDASLSYNPNYISQNNTYEEVDSGTGQSNGGTISMQPNSCYTQQTSSYEEMDSEMARSNGTVEVQTISSHTKQEKTLESYRKAILALAMVVSIVALYTLLCSIVIVTTLAEVSSLKSALEDSQQQVQSCGSYSELEDAIEQLNVTNALEHQQLQSSIDSLNLQVIEIRGNMDSLGSTRLNPAASCASLPASSPAGHYWVRASNGSVVLVYCSSGTCGGVEMGWRRVIKLDMTNASHACPDGLVLSQTGSVRTCVNAIESSSCASATFPNKEDTPYSQVCGRITAYQFGSPDGFHDNHNLRSNPTIDTFYVDGASLTHGSGPREHIWTFVAALDDVAGGGGSTNCPCPDRDAGSRGTPPPTFVGDDYFCDSAVEGFPPSVLLTSNPLWDGEGCREGTCCLFNDPPWFHKQLPQPTADDIELRLCRDYTFGDEHVAIELIEIYVE